MFRKTRVSPPMFIRPEIISKYGGNVKKVILGWHRLIHEASINWDVLIVLVNEWWLVRMILSRGVKVIILSY